MTIGEPRILYEDDCLLLVEKPAGMPSQPDLSGQESMLSFLQKQYPFVGLVHRLDTPTGGVMLFAKDKSYVGKLTDIINDKENTQKIYLVLTPCPPPEPEGVWEDYLYHDKLKNKSFVVQPNAKGEIRKGAKYAKLSYRVIKAPMEGITMVEVRLFTGRTHQIRVQFASRGLPLLGDRKYGCRCPIKNAGLALWAYKLVFRHPKTQELMDVESLPAMSQTHWQIWARAAQAAHAKEMRDKKPLDE